ncbi:glycerophosphodiester phosphodiesterase [Microbacterium sp.]|uniref:glycerophosphodiester phosphodiesterase n=1 Tax=Microbacterium sp. TaxID=51671 RepID=UPI0039E504F7
METVTGGFSGAAGAAAHEASITGGLTAAPPIGVPIKLGDGSTAYLSYLDSTGVRKAPASVRVTQPAFLVSDSLTAPGVTMGHRGASGTAGHAEMSRKAYRYAATQRGYRMLEFSCNVTSDGVFVGTHDNNLSRTSQTTGLADLNTMTWADVQAYMNTLNASTPQPYYRLEEFLDEFTPEATVHVDPKYAKAGMAPFLAVLNAHGGPERIVFKYVSSSVGAALLADAAKAAGYTTAGYFYEADWASGAIDAIQSRWDILGMEYTASTDAWSRTTTGAYPGLRSYGKPVLAHVIPSAAAYDTAKTKIEEGGWVDGTPGHTWIAQVSRPDLVAPVW